MLRIIEVVTAILLAIAFFLVVGLFLPKTAHIQRTIEIGSPISQVYDALNGFHRFKDWSPWLATDPGMQTVAEGERFGEGATVRFTGLVGGKAGVGSLAITQSEFEPGRALIRMALDNEWSGDNKRTSFKLEQDRKTRAVHVQWDLRVDYGWDLIGRYKGMYLDGTMGEQMESSLHHFATMMASVPLVDYSQKNIEIVDRAGGVLLYVGGGVPSSPREWDEKAEPLMERSWKQVEDFMKANHITPSGPKTRVINIIGDEAVDASMAYPVADSNVTPSGNIRIGGAYIGQALAVTYTYKRAGIGAPNGPREQLKAYAMTHGYEFAWDGGGQFEEWITDANEEGLPETRVYLPVAIK